ncbi:hypothetical protein C1Y63_01515 [Corynebacterium sp. 13CS0277]|uniref:ECF transporter S component n=1 Tax=Corynebacterium sp. 13CS0277 TaxID=2071994 RepID=UPI000D02FFD0|nr:ECF transporter S component [Corynebacterium sp. 13CS0277]PRQ12267.1 hypothetical protein C1Y63_01515 [Corynebacterium sp. 13CS0277]
MSTLTVSSSATTARKWRVVDILVASVLGIAVGVVFLVWNSVGYAWYEAANALTPGMGGIATGGWLIGGTLGGLIIRKPGAALYVEVLASITSMAGGSQWSISTVYSGIAQGLGAEIVFLLFGYKVFNILVAALAGIGAGLGALVLEGFLGTFAKGATYVAIYGSTMAVSGALIAGVLMYFVVRALAATGALDRFAAGRERGQLV